MVSDNLGRDNLGQNICRLSPFFAQFLFTASGEAAGLCAGLCAHTIGNFKKIPEILRFGEYPAAHPKAKF